MNENIREGSIVQVASPAAGPDGTPGYAGIVLSVLKQVNYPCDTLKIHWFRLGKSSYWDHDPTDPDLKVLVP